MGFGVKEVHTMIQVPFSIQALPKFGRAWIENGTSELEGRNLSNLLVHNFFLKMGISSPLMFVESILLQ